MEISIFLAKVIGLISVISTLAVLARYKTFLKMEEEAVKYPVLVYLSGFLILIIGVLLVVSHQVWTRDWRLVITIIGWLILLKGSIRIFFPGAVRSLIEKKQNNHWFLLADAAVFLIGLYLVYQGFFVYGVLQKGR